MLKAARRTISAYPNIDPEAVACMAQTMRTVENRLGVNTDNIITTYTLCPKCSRRYSADYIATTNNDVCLNDGCEGVLFTSRELASGGRRRVSAVTYPFTSPIAWIQHMLSRPGMAELLQNWRSDRHDDHVFGAPISCEEWMRNLDINRPLGDISDGWGWRSTYAGLERREDPETGLFTDENAVDPPIRFTSLPFGLSFSLNTDWFQATKEGNYSVGACYLVLNNLPRHLRFLQENIALCIVLPGPNEPNSYALDQMLEPLVSELLQLKQGVNMLVRQGIPAVYHDELVHGELTQQIADLMACIKMCGGAGVKSEHNFCLYCHSRLLSLSVVEGFNRGRFDLRNPAQDLNNAYQWKNLQNDADRKALFEVTGNCYTALHDIPGWHAPTLSHPDAMHLLYLGGMNWIIKQVLVGPGIFNKRNPGDIEPQDIFNNCMKTMWIPKSFQRLPPKLGQTRSTTKADQWKLMSRILYIPLFLALRTGDVISGYAPTGNPNSSSSKHVAHRAKLFHQQRQKYYQANGIPEQCPPLAQCVSSCNLRFHYRQALRFCLAVNIIDKRSITPSEIGFSQQLLELLCADYIRNNVQLPPNFHYMMHLEEFMLKTGSVYNTHVWAMERANAVVSKINHNGRSSGVLEGTLIRGWWKYLTIQNLIRTLESLPNQTEADKAMISDLLVALKGGSEDAQHTGTLEAFIAQCQTDYTKLYGIHAVNPVSFDQPGESWHL
ncbi:Transposase family tnp2 [Ceratobasidium sp. AG-Ba]|nr:Transposase family tnp2 [Ceratobasidium sp. AG-Ba]